MIRLRLPALAAALAIAGTLGAPSLALAQTEAEVMAAADADFEAALELLNSDPVAGLARIEAMAATGDPEMLNLLASVLGNPPDGLAADPVRAEALQRRAIEGGSDAARLNLGTALLMNDWGEDDAEAVAMLTAITNEQLIPYSAFPLGRAYLFGAGVERDLTRGSTLMIQAAALSPDNIDARFLAGRALQNGWGVPVDEAAARGHLMAAADAGDPRAQWNLGMMLLDGRGGSADPQAAYGYVRQAAEQGHIDGQISLAVMLALGQGAVPNPAESRVWYGRAAQAGSAHALRGLGMMLLVGEGGDPNPVTGAAYLELAAVAGEENALRLLTYMQGEIAKLDRAAIDGVKADWIAAHGAPKL